MAATSSNPGLIPAVNLIFGGSGPNRTVTIQPEPGPTGKAIITITVADQGPQPARRGKASFRVSVVANQPPAISSIEDQAIVRNRSTPELAFAVRDAETAAENLALQADSGQVELAPIAGIVLGGRGSNRTVRITPNHHRTGVARITITATDSGGKSASTSFNLSVLPPPAVHGDLKAISMGMDRPT